MYGMHTKTPTLKIFCPPLWSLAARKFISRTGTVVHDNN